MSRSQGTSQFEWIRSENTTGKVHSTGLYLSLPGATSSICLQSTCTFDRSAFFCTVPRCSLPAAVPCPLALEELRDWAELLVDANEQFPDRAGSSSMSKWPRGRDMSFTEQPESHVAVGVLAALREQLAHSLATYLLETVRGMRVQELGGIPNLEVTVYSIAGADTRGWFRSSSVLFLPWSPYLEARVLSQEDSI